MSKNAATIGHLTVPIPPLTCRGDRHVRAFGCIDRGEFAQLFRRTLPLFRSIFWGSVQRRVFVEFSCQQRCLYPSCHQKRTLLAGETIAQTICAPVPHRQLVFTIPERLRVYCRHDLRLLGKLTLAAWHATVEVYRQVLGRRDVIPGIQTFGELR